MSVFFFKILFLTHPAVLIGILFYFKHIFLELKVASWWFGTKIKIKIKIKSCDIQIIRKQID